MKKYSHAWLAFMAVKRLKHVSSQLTDKNKKVVNSLTTLIMHHEDDIIQGSWYPDAVIKDMANSHVLKMTPSAQANNQFETLPSTHMVYRRMENSQLKNTSFDIEEADNLPDRCESITQSIIDNAKMQRQEKKGSPVAPTNNHITLIFFMLSHYIADAHMPLHCDSRSFSEGADIHGEMEKEWDNLIKSHYEINKKQERFLYDPYGFPLRNMDKDTQYQGSYLKRIEDELDARAFRISYGTSRDKTWDFMSAICQYSYLLSYEFIPSNYTHHNVTKDNWDSIGSISFDDLSVAVLSDAIDSISHVWFRAWRRYMKWAKQI